MARIVIVAGFMSDLIGHLSLGEKLVGEKWERTIMSLVIISFFGMISNIIFFLHLKVTHFLKKKENACLVCVVKI